MVDSGQTGVLKIVMFENLATQPLTVLLKNARLLSNSVHRNQQHRKWQWWVFFINL